ncbi:MAG TPA: hypothetical protein VFK20_12800 [Vicinamibacterales bacterium]|nr:hypothetical protein [Vicinamibacterales bacterium]
MRPTRTDRARLAAARALIAALLLSAAAVASAANRYDPRLRFRTIATPHFDVHFHQGEDRLARRLAIIVEEVRGQLAPSFGTIDGRVHVILVNQNDVANGWATPLPVDTIEIAASPPAPESLIGNTADWLRVVFTHEYTHILHLDRRRGFASVLSRIFGRHPVLFPNQFLPHWQIEGLATFEESAAGGDGRIPAGDFSALLDAAARQQRLLPIDRAGGGLVAWPGGNAPYAYGGYFHQFLADRYGPASLRRLADATAGRVPYLGAPAFRTVYGRSLGELWDEFERERARKVANAEAAHAGAARLTHHGFDVFAPATDDDGGIIYAVSNPDRFPALMSLTRDGAPTRVAWRVGGGRTTVRDGWIVFDQLERIRSVGLQLDLYAVRTTGGVVHWLTHEARAGDPDFSPDGHSIVCTIQRDGRHVLARLPFDPDGQTMPTILLEDEGDYAGPRWSPDGSTIVAERRRVGGPSEIVLIDVATRGVRVLLARSDARLVTPSWTPDGRTILFAADLDGGPFEIYAADVATGDVFEVTSTHAGAQFPETAPDDRLVYVGYTADGYDLFERPLDRRAWRPVEWSNSPAGPTSTPADTPIAGMGYRPWRSLMPVYWTPIALSDADEILVGAATAMTDVLGRHAYAATAAWSGARSRPDWSASYVYDRWTPAFFADYSDDTDPVGGGRELRSREFAAGMLLPVRRIRRSQTFLASFDAERDTLTCASGCAAPRSAVDRRSLRGGWLFDSRRLFGYSISVEEGWLAKAIVESTRRALGADGDAGAAVMDVRHYWRLNGGHIVLAARGAGATAWGDNRVRRTFGVGGSGPAGAGFDVGEDAIGLLRGASATPSGPHAAVINLDVRVPIAFVERGWGTVPVSLRSIHAAAFADAAHAWRGRFSLDDVGTSFGAEVSFDTVLGYVLPVTFAGGVAWVEDTAPRRATTFARIGAAF